MVASEAPQRETSERTVAAIHLLATTSRNATARLLHAAGVTVVVACFLGPIVAAVWFATVSVTGAWINAIVKSLSVDNGAVASRWSRHGLLAANVINSAATSLVCATLWFEGSPASRLCAMLIIAIGSAYSLLRFSSDATILATLLAPPSLSLACIALKGTEVQAHGSFPSATAVAAVLICLINFVAGSRRQIIADRDKLEKARQRAAEGERAAEAANEAKSQFLATMSHEIRTPLNGVLGMAQAMAGDQLSERQRERLDIVRQSGESLLAILNDILDLSKIEAGKLELEAVEFSLSEVARGAHAAFTGLANKKGLSFCLEMEGDCGTYRGDPVRLRQIMYNLISNALKFTDVGEVRVVLSWRQDVLSLIVSDTGVGIAPEAMGRLFNNFAQADASTTRRFGGTGLGLAICRHLAEAMNGSISVESQRGQGSRFVVSLPLEQISAEPAEVVRTTAPADPSGAFERPVRVLAAEDNSVNQLVLKTLLHQAGIQPVMVDNGAAAVEAWEREEWDVILMDVQMPHMDGPTATRRIRELERQRGGRRTPILALTANAMSDQVAQYLAAGMDGHVAKPIEINKLFTSLERALAETFERQPVLEPPRRVGPIYSVQ